jgi:DDE_Tnp_1-associated
MSSSWLHLLKVRSRRQTRGGSDPRQSWKVIYPLPEVLLIVLCGTMAGAEDFVEIERWARRKLDFLRRMLPFARGIPSHDTARTT